MSVHHEWDLKQMQSLPLEAKVLMSQRRIKDWYEHWEGQVYVSFSGGKDSTVLKHLVDGLYNDVPALFVNTGLEYPELQHFATSQPNVVTVRPKMRFDEVIKRHGYPMISKDVSQTVKTAKYNPNTYRAKKLQGIALDKQGRKSMFNMPKWQYLAEADFDTSAKCCDVMKKSPIRKYEKETGRKPFIGTLASESRNRLQAWMRNGCNAFDSVKPISQPLAFWAEEDILAYLKNYNVPYASVYGDIVETENGLRTTGCDRTGCIFCGFGCHMEREPNRFQRMKQTHPRQYEYCIGGGEYVDGKWQPSKDGLGLGHVLDYIGIKY